MTSMISLITINSFSLGFTVSTTSFYVSCSELKILSALQGVVILCWWKETAGT